MTIKRRFSFLLAFIAVIFVLIAAVNFMGFERNLFLIGLLEKGATPSQESIDVVVARTQILYSGLISIMVIGFVILTIFVLKMRRAVMIPLESISEKFHKLNTKQFDLQPIPEIENVDEMTDLTASCNTFLTRFGDTLLELQRAGSMGVEAAISSKGKLHKLKETIDEIKKLFDEILPTVRDGISSSKSLLDVLSAAYQSIEGIANLGAKCKEDVDSITDNLKRIGEYNIADQLKSIQLDQFSDFADNIRKVSERAEILSINASSQAEQSGQPQFNAIAEGIKHFSSQVGRVGDDFKNVISEVKESLDNSISKIEHFGQIAKEGEKIGSKQIEAKEMEAKELLSDFQVSKASIESQIAAMENVDDFLGNMNRALETISIQLKDYVQSGNRLVKFAETVHRCVGEFK